mmetsp:Transcript_13484/g.44224  ORF Transcript_13484/g.44224 Transcript_13484/m.44224 type:complete len:113 (+) Transcript_13484:609-947(+)
MTARGFMLAIACAGQRVRRLLDGARTDRARGRVVDAREGRAAIRRSPSRSAERCGRPEDWHGFVERVILLSENEGASAKFCSFRGARRCARREAGVGNNGGRRRARVADCSS